MSGSMLTAGVNQSRYTIVAPLGKGASSEVFLGTQRNIGRQVAIKVLRPDVCGDDGDAERYMREASIVASLRHPNIVTVYDVGVTRDGRPFMVMEYVPGSTLARVLTHAGALPVARAIPLFEQICSALTCAHRRGVIHRDVKPGNVLLEDQSSGYNLAKLSDFGVARLSDNPQTQIDRVIGTPAFMAPELFEGERASPSSDIYALGVLMYRSVTGYLPFDGENAVALAWMHRSVEAPLFNDVADDLEVPRPLEEVVRRCLEKAPHHRYPSTEDVLQELVAVRLQSFPHVPNMTTGVITASREMAPRRTTSPPPPGSPSQLLRYLVLGMAIGTMVFMFAIIGLVVIASQMGWLSEQERPPMLVEAPPPPRMVAPAPAEPIAVDSEVDAEAEVEVETPITDAEPIPLPPPALPAPPAPPTRRARPARPARPAPPTRRAPAVASRPSVPPRAPDAVTARVAVVDAPTEPAPPPVAPPPTDAPSEPEAGSAAEPSNERVAVVADRSPSESPVVDLTGSWTGTFGGRPLRLRLTDKGGVLSGTLRIQMGPTEINQPLQGRHTSEGGGERHHDREHALPPARIRKRRHPSGFPVLAWQGPRRVVRDPECAMIWLLTTMAWAGDGPWTLGPRQTNLYLGMDYFRYESFRDGDGDLTTFGGLAATGFTGIVTRGIARNVEVEVRVPFERVRAVDPEGEFCTDGPRRDWCEASAGLGDLFVLTKFRFLDESNLKPVSASIGLAVRTGEFYSERRGRLTTLGDGQTDVGGIASVGRVGNTGQGWYQVSATAYYWHRFPHDAGPPRIPADELGGEVTALISPTGRFALGPVAVGFTKLGGFDIEDAPFDTLNGFASLQGSQVKVGGKLGIFGQDGVTLSASVFATVFAINNPSDTLSVSVGLGWFIDAKRD